MRGLGLSFSDYIKAGLILAGAAAIIWVFMIRPYSYDWQPAGETRGEIKTLMSNSNVIGAASINAVITLEDQKQTIVKVPLRANIRAGSSVILAVQVDADNPKRKRYQYKRAQ